MVRCGYSEGYVEALETGRGGPPEEVPNTWLSFQVLCLSAPQGLSGNRTITVQTQLTVVHSSREKSIVLPTGCFRLSTAD